MKLHAVNAAVVQLGFVVITVVDKFTL